MNKNKVDGIILVLSCQKHLYTRLKQFKLSKDIYGEWKVIYVIGDLFLNSEYKIDGNLMTIKCEDSYIHLLKKLVLALKYVYELYDIKEGILRSGDDLIYNEIMLQSFLESNKLDFVGKSPSQKGLLEKDITPDILKTTTYDNFMVNYYLLHPEDFNNPQHNLKGININKFMKRPKIEIGACGVLFYISNKCSKILIDHLESINYNIFHFDDYSQSYPYTIEDCAVSYILYLNKISFIHNDKMWSDFQTDNTIAYHTNMYK
jgi:hypothetical protein